MPVAARSTRTLDLFRGSPVTAPDDATAAILTVTVVAPDRAGDLTVYATDLGRPAVSTVNFAPGTPTPNAAVVPLVGSRRISLYNASLGNAHVIVSLRGWCAGRAANGPGRWSPAPRPASSTPAAPGGSCQPRGSATSA